MIMKNLLKISRAFSFKHFETASLRAFSEEVKKNDENLQVSHTIHSKLRSDTAIVNNFIYRLGIFRKKGPEPNIFDTFRKDLEKIEDFSLISNLLFAYSRAKVIDNSLINEHFTMIKKNKAEIMNANLDTQVKLMKNIIHMRSFLSKKLYEEMYNFSKEIFLQILDLKETSENIKGLNILQLTGFLLSFNDFIMLEHEICFQVLNEMKKKLLNSPSNEDLAKAIFAISKFYNTIEFSKNSNNNEQVKKIKEKIKEIFSEAAIIEKLRNILLSNLGNQVQVMKLSYVYSRLNINDAKLWQLLLDFFQLNYKKLDNQKFKTFLSSLLMRPKKSLNKFFMIEIKSEFDSRLEKLYKSNERNNDFFIRGIRSFVGAFTSVLDNEDHSIELYEKYIKTNFNSFKINELVSLNYVFAIIVYKNEEIINMVLNKILKDFEENPQRSTSFYFELFFWSNAVMKTNNTLFWKLYQEFFLQLNLENLNESNCVRHVLPLYFLLNFRKNLIIPNNLQVFEEKLDQVLEISNEKVFSHYLPQNLNIEGFNFYQMCKIIGLKFFIEVIVEIYPSDFYIEDFFLVDFDKKIQELDQMEENYFKKHDEFSLEFYRMKKSVKEIKKYVSDTKENSLVVEIDGILHYNNSRFYEKGNSLQKKEILKEKGYHLMVLNYENCENIASLRNLKERIRFILELFKTIKEKKTFK